MRRLFIYITISAILVFGAVCFLLFKDRSFGTSFYLEDITVGGPVPDSTIPGPVITMSGVDTAEIRRLCNQIEELNQTDPDAALPLAQSTLAKAQALGDPASVCNATHFLGLVYDYLNNLKEALYYYNAARDMAEQLNDTAVLAREYNAIGNIYITKGDYKAANENLIKSLQLFESINSERRFLPLVNLGNVYYYQKNLPLAIEYYEKALPLLRSSKREYYLAVLLGNIGVICENNGQYEKSKQYLREAFAMHLKLGDTLGMTTDLVNLGTTYQKLDQHDSSLYYLQQGMQLAMITNNLKELSTIYNNMGDHYLEVGQRVRAKEYFLKSKAISDSIGLPETLLYNYKGLAKTYQSDGDYANAFRYMEMFANLRDTMLTRESQRQMEEMNAKYESDKKDLEIAGLEKDQMLKDERLEKEENFRYLLSVIILLAFILAVAFIFAFINKRRDNRILQEQKKEIETAKNIIEEKNKDITDSINYASRIQGAILPAEETIRKALPGSFVLYIPRNIVSGDFYWFAQKNGFDFLAAVDCTGHGVPGSLMSMIGSNTLTQVVNETPLTETHEILNELHKRVVLALNPDPDQRQSMDGMDVALVRIDHRSKKLQFSGAVRPLVYFSKEKQETLRGDKYSIAGVKDFDTPYTVHSIDFSAGDCFFITSDGYADQFGGTDGKKLKQANLVKLFEKIKDRKPDEQKQYLSESFHSWRGDLEQVDDVCVIGVRL